jgi:hypothetical protein
MQLVHRMAKLWTVGCLLPMDTFKISGSIYVPMLKYTRILSVSNHSDTPMNDKGNFHF